MMMKALTNRKSLTIIGIVISSCVIMAIVDAIVQPPYLYKSIIKVFLFLGGPLLYGLYHKDNIFSVLKFQKKGLFISFSLGLAVFTVILGGYFLLRNVFEFSNIIDSLTKNGDITKDNFIYVSIYISFGNSFLEEIFFRGFTFLKLKKITSRKFAYLFSAIFFALYHVAIMVGWFSWFEYAVIVSGLFIGGIIFNYLCEKLECLYPAWFVHMFANFAINIIGMILFGII